LDFLPLPPPDNIGKGEGSSWGEEAFREIERSKEEMVKNDGSIGLCKVRIPWLMIHRVLHAQ
jgi:hypothetical protein